MRHCYINKMMKGKKKRILEKFLLLQLMDREGIASLRSVDEQTRSHQLISVVKKSVHSVEGLFWQNSAQMLYFFPSILIFEIVSHYYPGWL